MRRRRAPNSTCHGHGVSKGVHWESSRWDGNAGEGLRTRRVVGCGVPLESGDGTVPAHSVSSQAKEDVANL
jgi:hypothetical protein